MKYIASVAIFFLMACASIFCQTSEIQIDAERDQPEQMAELKKAWSPPVYSPRRGEFSRWADIAILFASMSIISLGVKRGRGRKFFLYISGFSLFYFGIFRGGCICPVGASANVFMGMVSPELVGGMTLILFMMPLVFALFFGRVFCGGACPLGAIQELLQNPKSRLLPRRLDYILHFIPYLVLASMAAFAFFKILIFTPCELDFFKPLFFTGHAFVNSAVDFFESGVWNFIYVGSLAAWILFFVAIIFARFVPRFFCRYLCPYAVLLSLISHLAFFPNTLKKTCTHCRKCERACPQRAIKDCKIVASDCVCCGICKDSCANFPRKK